MISFYVGQKVICVDASRKGDLDGLTEGKIYTIRWFGEHSHEDLRPWPVFCRPGINVRLKEIVRPKDYRGFEIGYLATRFRPLIETDISVFTAMLAPKPVNVREPEDA